MIYILFSPRNHEPQRKLHVTEDFVAQTMADLYISNPKAKVARRWALRQIIILHILCQGSGSALFWDAVKGKFRNLNGAVEGRGRTQWSSGSLHHFDEELNPDPDPH